MSCRCKHRSAVSRSVRLRLALCQSGQLPGHKPVIFPANSPRRRRMPMFRARAASIGVLVAVGVVLALIPGVANAAGDHVAVCSTTNLLGPVFTTEQDTNWFHPVPAVTA